MDEEDEVGSVGAAKEVGDWEQELELVETDRLESIG